jgi:GAF domain-containing protein
VTAETDQSPTSAAISVTPFTSASTGSLAFPALADPDRLAELAATGLADGRSDEVFDRFARIAASLLDAPVSYVSLVGSDRQVMPGAVVLDAPDTEPSREIELRGSICSFSVATGDETVIPDVRSDPLVRANETVQNLPIRAYAGWPLTTDGGHVLGNLCVMDRQPRDWTDHEVRMLRDLASLVLEELRHRVTKNRLAQLRDHADALWQAVPDARDAVRLLAEEADRTDHPALLRAAATATAGMDRVARAAGQLRPELEATADDVLREPVDVAHVVERAMVSTRAATGAALEWSVEVEPGESLAMCDPIALERALSQLLVAGVHHTDGRLLVTVRREDEAVLLEVRGEGVAMPLTHLSRAVARLDAAFHPAQYANVPSGGASASPVRGAPDRRGASVRVAGGRVTATAGGVVGTTSASGFLVRAPLS